MRFVAESPIKERFLFMSYPMATMPGFSTRTGSGLNHKGCGQSHDHAFLLPDLS
jgi:hypothetical protein